MIAICDSLPEGLAAKGRVEHMIGQVRLIARQERGWRGEKLLDAEWFGENNALLIVIGPGHGHVTADEIAAFLREKKKAA